jgi:acetyl esterase/lipase
MPDENAPLDMSRTLTRRAALALPLLALGAADQAVAPLPSLPRVPLARPPGQPPDGPGGARVLYPRADRHDLGKGAQASTVFTPAGADSAPVVVFLHGWGATDPLLYGAWLDHICRRGRIVICPAYQDSLLTPLSQFTPNAIVAIKTALAHLNAGEFGVRPDRRGAYLGHSMGGALAARLACEAAADGGLPSPRAVMCVEPGVGSTPASLDVLGDLSRLQTGTLLITVVGDRDTRAGNLVARHIWLETVRVRPFDKAYVVINSDDHGAPALVADHGMPAAAVPGATLGLLGKGLVGQLVKGSLRRRAPPEAERAQDELSPDALGSVDSLDWYGTWKLFDALTDDAFYGFNASYALGGGSDQTFMGLWSDGIPVKRLSVLTPQ